jgi:formylmethanofuran--tetrahydromethanopterin N-formyltransferase
MRNGVVVADTFAEAFGMRATALVITAETLGWAQAAATAMTGFATSVIGCGCEAGVEREMPAEATPDGRPGVRILLFAVSTTALEEQLKLRVGQCVLTSPGSACYSGLDGEERLKLGDAIRYFGDGWQIAKQIGDRRFWRIPVMDGEFVCEDTAGLTKQAVGGGNLIVMARSGATALAAAEAAVAAMRDAPDVILPFPGGIARSGSKIGSRYEKLVASTNEAYCPTLRGRVECALPEGAASALEIVIDGLNEGAVAAAMRAGLGVLVKLGAAAGVVAVSAGNYGGKLGRFQYRLADLLP